MNGLATTVEVAIPVHNEERILAASVSTLMAHLESTIPYSWRIVIVDNASTDRTVAIAKELVADEGRIALIRLDRKGKGRAVRAAWAESDADVLVYTDVDLSSGLSGLLPLIAPLVSGHSDLAVGSRLSAGSSVARRPQREVISMVYNLLLRIVFAVRFRDAQCGFKAGRREVVQALLPHVHDDAWFFDAELLLLAEHNGLRIHEVPVDWVDNPDSRVNVGTTAIADLQGIWRMFWRFALGSGDVDLGVQRRQPLDDDFGRQTVTFGLIGAVATLVSLAVFVLLRDPAGAVGANVIGFAATVAGNSWANRRWTFRGRRDSQRWRRRLVTAVLLMASLVASSLAVVQVDGGRWPEVAVLFTAWTITAAIRFLALRTLVRRSD